MSRATMLPWAVLIAATCWSLFDDASCATFGTEVKRPNIVMVMCDDLGWADVGFNGNTTTATPHLDQWASQGLVFDRFYAAAPVCSPTRGSCLTGRHPYRYGVFGANSGHLKKSERTLPELLQQAGYATGHFGKWHLGTLTTKLRDSNRGGLRGGAHFAPPWQHGFDVCFSTEAKVPTWDPMLKPPSAGKKWWDPINEADAIDYGTHYWNEQAAIVSDNLTGDDSRVIMDRAIPFMRLNVSETKPFLAVIWFHAPHLPVVAGSAYTRLYSNYPKYEQHYYGCITALDDQMGRLHDELTRLGIRDDTLVFFCADNGPEGQAKSAPGSAGTLRGRKRDLFEGGIRVPAFAVWPSNIKPGQRTKAPVVTSDYLPTVLDLLSIKPIQDRPLDGVSVLSLLHDESIERQRGIGFQFTNQSAWIEPQYKLLRRGNETLLFDLIRDPNEANNIAAEHADIVSRMSNELDDWIESCQHSNQGGDYGS